MINSREIETEYRLSHWSKVMEERVQSGLTIKAFCRQIGIATNTYFYWQRKLREAACRALTPKSEAAAPSGAAEKSLVPSGWAVCEADMETPTPEPAPKTSPTNTLLIEIGGNRLTVDEGIELKRLSKICRMLKTLC